MDIEQLMNENKQLKQRIIELEDHLKKYTNSSGHRKYYEKNKERVMKNANTYLKKLAEENPDKMKEYRRRAYLNRKEKNKIQENRGNILVPPKSPQFSYAE